MSPTKNNLAVIIQSVLGFLHFIYFYYCMRIISNLTWLVGLYVNKLTEWTDGAKTWITRDFN